MIWTRSGVEILEWGKMLLAARAKNSIKRVRLPAVFFSSGPRLLAVRRM
jgi:hypothetical protein